MDYFSYTDGNGTEVIVQHLHEVPPQYRSHAKHIDLSKPAFELRDQNSQVIPARHSGLCLPGQSSCLHWPSVAVGAGSALLLGLVLVLVLRRASRLVRILVGLGAIIALSAAYLGYIRYRAGLSGPGLAGPGDLLEDARKAVKAVNRRNAEQARSLQAVDHQR